MGLPDEHDHGCFERHLGGCLKQRDESRKIVDQQQMRFSARERSQMVARGDDVVWWWLELLLRSRCHSRGADRHLLMSALVYAPSPPPPHFRHS